MPDLRLSRHHLDLILIGPSPPQPRRAARRAPRAALAHRAPPSTPQSRRTRAALAQCPSTRGLGRPRWAGFTPHASMVPYPTCRPRRGRSGSGCSRRLPSGCPAQRRTSITVGEAESCEHTDQASHKASIQPRLRSTSMQPRGERNKGFRIPPHRGG